MSVFAHEHEKYSKVWQLAAYGDHSPGLEYVDLFWSIAKPAAGYSVIDVGAGSGAASRALQARGLIVEAFDITDAGWDSASMPNIPITFDCVWHGVPRGFDYAFCCDVMEHIPTEYVGLSIENILRAARHAFFSVSFREDGFGRFVGEPLHLTVKPFTWWRDLFRELGKLEDARDLMGEGVFYVGR